VWPVVMEFKDPVPWLQELLQPPKGHRQHVKRGPQENAWAAGPPKLCEDPPKKPSLLEGVLESIRVAEAAGVSADLLASLQAEATRLRKERNAARPLSMLLKAAEDKLAKKKKQVAAVQDKLRENEEQLKALLEDKANITKEMEQAQAQQVLAESDLEEARKGEARVQAPEATKANLVPALSIPKVLLDSQDDKIKQALLQFNILFEGPLAAIQKLAEEAEAHAAASAPTQIEAEGDLEMDFDEAEPKKQARKQAPDSFEWSKFVSDEAREAAILAAAAASTEAQANKKAKISDPSQGDGEVPQQL